jgi:signal recognition particle subunit SRP54
MAFEGLSSRLQSVMQKLRGKGKVSEADVKEATREIRLALLEADVNFKVVKTFIDRVKERAIGQEVLKSLTPGQQVVKVVNEELTALMGGTESKLTVASSSPTVIMMVGLQGAGKTTSSGKLARLLAKQNKKPLLVAADIYRPAAIRQLEVLGEQLGVPVFSLGDKESPVDIAKQGIEKAKNELFDTVIIDTAGRLHVDEQMMDELRNVRQIANPDEVLLVIDAMTGQDAVNVAESFHREMELTGVILTKLDGDTRGGAALLVKAVTNCPIKFVGMGEKTDALEHFHPDRMASRILGMGDVLSLIEKAQETVDLEKAKELEKKMRSQKLTLNDFLDQLQQVRKMGPLEDMLAMIPGANAKALKNVTVDEKKMDRIEAIIRSMTVYEKDHPEILNASRRRRIAMGSGTSVQEVNQLLKQFQEMKKSMKQMASMMKNTKKRKGFKFPFMG